MDHKKSLTASELGQIWGAYMDNSLSQAVLKYFIQKAEDAEIRSILRDTFDMAKKHQEPIKQYFRDENHPIPVGFTDEDINVNAPRLYTDSYMLQYVMQMGMLGMSAASTAISMSSREDIYDFFSSLLQDFNQSHRSILVLAKAKGIFVEPPTIPTPKEIDYVKKQNFLTGWFGDRRPLTTSEVSNLYSNIKRNVLGAATLMGFSQVAENKDVKDFLLRGVEIAKKHVNIFSEILEGNDVPVPMGSDAMVTNSSEVSPFSDKLMMMHTTGMIGLGIGSYGLSISTNIRRDIASQYTRLSGEIALYAEDGANILIKNGWLEEPPRMVDRDELASKKQGGH